MRRPPIETSAVSSALRQILLANATAAADENVLVARDEAGDLHPFLFGVQQRMREEGGPGTRVRVDALVERAMVEALAIWEQVNPAEHTLDHRWLALDEIAAIAKLDPQLGALTEQAAEQVRAEQTGDTEPKRVRAFFDAYDFEGRSLHAQSLPGGERIDARIGQPGRAEAPAAVQQAFDYFYRVEAADFATVSLHRADVAGHRVWVIYVSTDGDDAYLAVHDSEGTTVDGARLFAHHILAWDEFPGRVRLSSMFMGLHGVANEEGLSEPEERAAAGQPPSQWAGDARLDDTLVYPVGQQLGRIDFGDRALSPALRELAVAAIDQLWSLTLRYRVQGSEPVRLGPHDAGVLSVGAFTRPTDGQTYEVANWRDIDDASFVLYYLRDELGLHLEISQFDN